MTKTATQMRTTTRSTNVTTAAASLLEKAHTDNLIFIHTNLQIVSLSSFHNNLLQLEFVSEGCQAKQLWDGNGLIYLRYLEKTATFGQLTTASKEEIYQKNTVVQCWRFCISLWVMNLIIINQKLIEIIICKTSTLHDILYNNYGNSTVLIKTQGCYTIWLF